MAVAGIMIAKIVPSLLLGSVLGVLVDRFDRRRLMIACDLINGVLCLGLLRSASRASCRRASRSRSIYVDHVPDGDLQPAVGPGEERAHTRASWTSATSPPRTGCPTRRSRRACSSALLASGAIVAVFVAIRSGDLAAPAPALLGVSSERRTTRYLTGPHGRRRRSTSSRSCSPPFLICRIRAMRSARAGRERALDLRLFGRDVLESFTDPARPTASCAVFLISIGLAILGGGAIVSVGLVYVQQNLVGGIPFLELVPPLQRAMASQAPSTFMMVFLAPRHVPRSRHRAAHRRSGSPSRRSSSRASPVSGSRCSGSRPPASTAVAALFGIGVRLLRRAGDRGGQHLHRRDRRRRGARPGLHGARVGPSRRAARLDGASSRPSATS